MEKLNLVDPASYKWLTNDCGTSIDTWAIYLFDATGISDHTTINMCESFNAYLVIPRQQSILTSLEFIRKKITKRLRTRYKKAYKDTYDGFIALVLDKCMWRKVDEPQWQPPQKSEGVVQLEGDYSSFF